MTYPHAGHGYIDFDGDDELFWRIETLWSAAAHFPVVERALDELPWRDDGCFDLGDPPKWGKVVEHCKRGMAADLWYPIILHPNGDIMDGMHRIMRAYVEGRSTIATVTLGEVPAPDRVRPRA